MYGLDWPVLWWWRGLKGTIHYSLGTAAAGVTAAGSDSTRGRVLVKVT